ncbi:hypothetical protein L226DRAFT_529742 [Lentinus tigrinus ALCF2SS1-7]|uniref:uncharacterized protein n=1 Tax=Lentinus tigrinus ALCF2SS1-7 TaxID=1328758 RepID=UPI001165F1AD|nr:hypothetical protein L226DRAFT_529742 [Lentinus tigrinus ALCF2SS1-7]
MYTRLCNAYEQSDVPGIILTGQPGIGKSYFSIYVLLQCLAKEKPVLFTTKEGDTFWFDQNGVQTCLASSMPRWRPDISSSSTGRQIWSLVDPGDHKVPIPRRFTSHRFIFYVLFTSPDQSRYKHLTNESAREWFMSPWTDHELNVLFTTTGMTAASTSSFPFEEVRRLRELAGPCPRDIKKALGDANGFDRALGIAHKSLTTRTVHDLLVQSTSSSNPTTQNVVLVKRNSPIDVNDMQSDTPAVTFKTAFVSEEVKKRYKRLELQNSQELFNSCNTGTSETAVLAGILFEGLALQLLCSGDEADLEYFSGFARMSAADTRGASAKSPSRFEYRSRASSSVITVSTDRTVQLVQTYDLSTPPATLILDEPKIPIPNVGKMRFHQHESPPRRTQPGVCYIPLVPANPLFDAYFYVRAGDLITLYIVQVAVSRARTGARSGSTTVKTLLEQARKHYGENIAVEVKYLLLAPYRDGLSVVWNMAKETVADVPGEVWVQFIDIGTGDWTVEAITKPED